MDLKETLKGVVEGTGDLAKSIMEATAGIVKEGTEDVGDIFGAVIGLGKDGVLDVAEGVKDVYVGAVKALEESGKTTEDAVAEVTAKAEAAISKIGEEGIGDVADAAKKGLSEAKEILKTPLK